jgi:hypothetical protein
MGNAEQSVGGGYIFAAQAGVPQERVRQTVNEILDILNATATGECLMGSSRSSAW